MRKRWNKEDASLHQACEDKDYKDKYTHVTLAGEDDKPEDGEELELRRCKSSPRTTRKRIIGKEIKEGRVVEQGIDFEGSSKSSSRSQKIHTGGEENAGG